MMTQIQLIMMLFFIVLFVISIVKLRSFLFSALPEDSDITQVATQTLMQHIKVAIDALHKEGGRDTIDNKAVFQKVLAHKEFDSEYFWRFNQNKCNNMLRDLHAKYKTQNLHHLNEKLKKEV